MIETPMNRHGDRSAAVDDAMMGAMGDQLLERGTAPIGGGDHIDIDDDRSAPDRRRGRIAHPLAPRIGARIVQRPRRWLDAPWPTDRVVRFVITLLLVGGATFAVVKAVHLDLVFTNNTPTGGDMGAHVMGPAFLRDHLLPNFQLSGWSNYWYAGFPMYRFYMVVPALMIVLLNVVFPYGIAFKLVVISGVVTLPLCCWAFGRLARFRYPMPELFAVAGLLFLFDESFSIYGGNVKSTMAGEFSFSIALSLGILGLGLFARGLETGKYRNWAAIVLALACLSHGIVLIFVALGALLLWLVWMDRTRFIYGLTVGFTTFLLAAFWVVPFLFNHAYMTDMKYGYRPSGASDSFWDMFFPLTNFFDIFITTFAVIGFVACVARRHLNGAWLGICTLALVAGVYLTKRQPAGHRPAVEPTPAAVRVPAALPADDGRPGRDGPGRRTRRQSHGPTVGQRHADHRDDRRRRRRRRGAVHRTVLLPDRCRAPASRRTTASRCTSGAPSR